MILLLAIFRTSSRPVSCLFLLIALIIFSGCKQGDTTTALGSGGDSPTTVTSTPKTPSSPASNEAKIGVTGYIRGAQNTMHQRLNRSIASDQFMATANSCTSGSFSVVYVGGGGEIVQTGTFDNGQFVINPSPISKELIVTFLCHDGKTLRCLAKPGDSGILCDPVADAILAAFESGLQKSLTSADFDNKPISNVAHSIVEAVQTDSSASETLKLAIQNCKNSSSDVADCYKRAIINSPFYGAFSLLQNMANDWSVESIFTLLTDVLDFQIGIDGIIYTDFGTKLDSWFNTDFVFQTRKYIANVIHDQILNFGSAYPFKIECSIRYQKYRNGGELKYSPVLDNSSGIEQPNCQNTEALLLNGLTQTQVEV